MHTSLLERHQLEQFVECSKPTGGYDECLHVVCHAKLAREEVVVLESERRGDIPVAM